MNSQKPSPQNWHADGIVQLHSIFYTIQGEGPFAGTPAVFIRLAGCNLQCPKCDTEYTKWATPTGFVYILDQVKEMMPNGGLVVITGGEPFRQNIHPLVSGLMTLVPHYHVQLETNGVIMRYGLPFDHPRFTIVCSPKTDRIHIDLLPHIQFYKYVGAAGGLSANDGLPINVLDHPVKERVARPPKHFIGKVYLQPLDEGDPVKNKENLKAVTESCLKHGHTLCLQVHKIAGVE